MFNLITLKDNFSEYKNRNYVQIWNKVSKYEKSDLL